jgi:hypothetical protein
MEWLWMMPSSNQFLRIWNNCSGKWQTREYPGFKIVTKMASLCLNGNTSKKGIMFFVFTNKIQNRFDPIGRLNTEKTYQIQNVNNLYY